MALVLAGCKSEGERLSEYFDSGQAYAAQGDHARAIIQFRNALKIDADDADTRAAIAESLLEQGDRRQAQQEFTLLSERFPETLHFRSKLGEIALMSANWRELERQADAADAIDAAALDARALRLATRFRAVRGQSDPVQQAEIAAEAQVLLATSPAHPVLIRVVLDHLTSGDTPADALPVLDAALSIEPQDAQLQLLRIRLLAQSDQGGAAESRLIELATLYPHDPQIAALLVARHMSTGQTQAAEQVLRALANSAPQSDTEMRSVLVRFLQSTRGTEAALTELARLRDEAGDTSAGLLYAAMDRSLRFDQGDRDGAIEGLQTLIDTAGDVPEAQILQVLLARMHDRLGNRPEARKLVETVLGVDSGDVGALKLRATWAIDEEDPKSAIVDLRNALAQRQRDGELMTLLAVAHDLDGNRALALEQLAGATEATGHSSDEALRYAMALEVEGRDTVALRVLDVARDAQPGNLDVLRLASEIRLRGSDWPGLQSIITTLRRIGTPEANALRGPIEAAVLLGSGRAVEADNVVGDMLDGDPDRQIAFSRLMNGLMERGDLMIARDQLDRAMVRHADDVALQLLDADLSRQEGRLDRAEDRYRALIADGALDDASVLRLFGLLAGQDRREEADAVLAAGLTSHPDSRALRLIESNRLQVTGDRAGSLAILEALHAENPMDAITANNLASMLTDGDTDAATLQRAARIVAPLRGTMNPAVSDTIGWIAFRRGDAVGALPLMERAARGLPGDANVLLRLGQVHAALGQTGPARQTFQTVLTLTGDDTPIAQNARSQLSALGG